ncbi:calcium homeostasis endoplasmic reticulum protein [Tribonema minus]|uniref:Calcium homeostasis endoplasmic reticulum protein n=1 Tax=Tribonema minus TaxID=303371 RepID=A0A835YPB1_9STRA|nr:calcium homeostasis endoplasmic reticulum protein [Tribonema minus]
MGGEPWGAPHTPPVGAPASVQSLFPVAAGMAPHGQDIDNMQVGIMVALVRAALRGGAKPYAPINAAAMPPAKPPHIEPGRLEVRLDDFYRRLTLEDDKREREIEREERRREREYGDRDRRGRGDYQHNRRSDSRERDRGGYRERRDWGDRGGGRGGGYRPPPQAMPETQISEENVGFQALKKMGWQEGAGLGVGGKGIAEPVKGGGQMDRGGIGVKPPSGGGGGPEDMYEQYRKAKSYNAGPR